MCIRDRFPWICPIFATSFQKKGINASRLAFGSSSQKRSFKSVVSLTYSELATSRESAPVKSSCQRKPSKVIKITLVSFAFWALQKLPINKDAIQANGNIDFFILNRSLSVSYTHLTLPTIL